MVKFSEFFTHDFPDEQHLPSPRSIKEEAYPDPYPVGSLPPLIRDVVIEVASFIQAPEALIAASALSAVSTAVQSCFSVERDVGLDGPATLYLLTVAESGERKSSVDRLFTGPLREWEADQKRLYRERMAIYETEIEDWERQGEDMQKNIADGFLQVQAGTNLDPRVVHQLAKPEKPLKRRMLRGDDTPEALAHALDEYPVAAIISAEAGTIFGSHGMNPDAVTRNLAQANQLWDGTLAHRGRVGTGEVQVDVVRVTMGLSVQPAVLDAFVHKTGGLARGIGYLARFLFSRPETTQGSRFYNAQPASRPAQEAFGQQMTRLLNLEPSFDEHDRILTKLVGFDPAAQVAWIRFHDEVEEKLNFEHEYAAIRDVASKAADNAARLACCLHIFCSDHTAPISREFVESANMLMRWYLEEAVRFAQTANAAPELADAQLLEDWLVTQIRKRPKSAAESFIAVNEVRRKGPNCLRKAKSSRLSDALEILSDHHRVLVLRRAGRKGQDIYLRRAVVAEYSQ